jgi:hypothetical protein
VFGFGFAAVIIGIAPNKGKLQPADGTRGKN